MQSLNLTEAALIVSGFASVVSRRVCEEFRCLSRLVHVLNENFKDYYRIILQP
jgi:hypothetical protein